MELFKKIFNSVFLVFIVLSLSSQYALAKKHKGSGFFSAKKTECSQCQDIEGYVSESEVDDAIRKMVGKYKGGSGSENVSIQKKRGVIETYLRTEFINGASCPEIDSEKWAIDYSHKRSRAALHKGIDIPQPRGTPIRAISDGTVVANFLNKGNRKGIEIMLRHTPEQTGLPFWVYSQYTHLEHLSNLEVGTKVRMGDIIGTTSNTGKMGRRVRRDALHFAIIYSQSPDWAHDGFVVTPKDGYFMDPIAFYRDSGPYDSISMRNLPDHDKGIDIPYMTSDGQTVPERTKKIWPYVCES